MAVKNRKPIRGALSRHSSKGIPRFEVGGLNQIDVTAPMPTEAERAEYFRTHDENGNLIIPNEFAPPSIPGTGVKLHDYNLPYEYSLPRLGVAGIEALTTLGTGALAYPLGAAYGIGSNLLSGKYGTAEGARLADEEAAKAAEAMTYIPRTKTGQEAVEGLGDIFEALKIPPIIPELAGLQGMRRPMPDDVRAIGGKGLELAEDVRNLKNDYLNAQEGITRERPTLGASLQRKAKKLGDYVAERQANEREFRQNYSLMPSMAEAGKSYAVFPKGTPKRNVLKFKEANTYDPSDIVNPWYNLIKPILTDDLIYNYTESVVPRLYDLQRASPDPAAGLDALVEFDWTKFKAKKAQELYPDLPPRSALQAFNKKYENRANAEKQEILRQWLDEYSQTNELGLPPLNVLKENEEKAVKVVEQTFPNMFASMIGQEGKDFPVDLAMKGIMLEDPKQLIEDYNNLSQGKKDHLALVRMKAGLPREGLAQQARDSIIENLRSIDDELAELTQTKWAMEEQWTDRDNQPAPEGYKELTRRETKLTDEKKRLQKQAKAMEAAPALEAFNDLSMITSEKPSELKRMISRPEHQFYPQLEYKKDPETGAYLLRTDEQGALKPELVTPENEEIFTPNFGFTPVLKDLMRKYAEDIQAGKTEKSFQQYYLQEAQKRGKAREAKALIEANREKFTKQNYMNYVDSVPSNKVFGDYAAVEFTPTMSPEEIVKGLSIDTDELNHCVASGDRVNGKHVGIYDPATGSIKDGMRSSTSSETEKIINGRVDVTSIRDRSTGKPVVTIKFERNGTRKFDLDFISGSRNGPMDFKANYALRDYLNSRANEISNSGSNLTQHEVYDLQNGNHRNSAARQANERPQDLEDYLAANPNVPRFVTLQDVKEMFKPENQSTAVATVGRQESFDELLQMRDNAEASLQLALDEGEPNEVVSDLRSSIADLDARLNSHPDTIRANNLVRDPDITAYLETDDPATNANIENIIRRHGGDQGWSDEQIDRVQMADGNWTSIPWLRDAVRSELENQRAPAPVDQGWLPWQPAANIARELQDLNQIRTLSMEQDRRRMTLVDTLVDRLQPEIIPFTETDSPVSIANHIAESYPGIPPTVLADLISSRTTAETRLGVRGLPDEQIRQVVTELINRDQVATPVDDQLPTIEEIDEYISQMEEDDIVSALVNSGMDEGEVNAILAEDPQSLAQLEDLTALVQTHLVENPDILAAMREANDWEPEPPMTLPAPTTGPMASQDSYTGLLERVNSIADASQLRESITTMEQPPTRARFTPEQLAEIDGVLDSKRRHFFNEHARFHAMNGIAQSNVEAVLDILVPGYYRDLELMSPEAAADSIEATTGFPSSLLMADVVSQFPERFGIGRYYQGQQREDVINVIRDRALIAQAAAPAQIESPAQDLFQRMNEAQTLEDLRQLRSERRERNAEFSMAETQMLLDAARQRALEIRNAQPVLPDAVVERLNNIENISDQALVNWLSQAESNAPNTVWHRLDEEQTREVVTAIEYEIGRRGLDGANLGMQEGGVVHMSEGGLWEGYGAPMGESPNYYKEQEDSPVHSRTNLNYGNRKYSNADVSWNEISTDVDLLNKYGVGATKQSSVVKLHNDKIKQSDISELRARYATDDGTQYAVSRRPLDRTWSVRRSEPRDQSSLSVDISPDYKGISYTKNFAEGGAVYDHDSVSSMADELLGSMNFAEGGPALSVGRGEKLPVSRGAGLTAKGRAKANRATGSNLKAPAPHPKTEADANRRKSFCARMSGMPGPMKDDNGNPTRKAASLKRWNC